MFNYIYLIIKQNDERNLFVKEAVKEMYDSDMILNYHLMHPGEHSMPGDPNVAFCLDGIYHLHYIIQHPWKDGKSYSFIHVTSPDLLHWTWQTTKLQPSFTGHGMFSGTAFITKDGKPAAIYAALSNPRHTYISIAADNRLSRWEKPYPVLPKGGPEGKDIGLLGDPDCFIVDDTYYAFSASDNVLLCKSTDLIHWTYVGPFLKHDMPDVAVGEDISCANFFRLGNKWMLLCISHFMGCRYYLGDWDAETEQFVPHIHERMNWRRPEQSLTDPIYRDFFAPESVLTPDGRRIMWSWLATLDSAIEPKTIQSLPRELSLDDNGRLRIQPLRELKSLRYDARIIENIVSRPSEKNSPHIADLKGNSFEICIHIKRCEAERRRLGVILFNGGGTEGFPVLICPESKTICAGDTEAPFAVAGLPAGENVELRIFIDKYLIEVFVNGRQAVVNSFMDYQNTGTALKMYCFHGRKNIPAKIEKVEIWKLKPTNQGFLEAQNNRIWEPNIE